MKLSIYVIKSVYVNNCSREVKKLFVILSFLLFPYILSAQYNVDRLIMSGRVAVYYEDYVLGIQYFNQAISLKPYLWEPWQMRAIAKFNLDDYRGAESDASEAIKLNPYINQLYDLRGIARIRQDNFKDAISDYDKAISLQPTNRNYWYNKAICRMEMKDYENAHLELDSIIRRWSTFASPYLLKAEVFLQEGDTVKAEKWIGKSLDIDPYNAEAWRARASISLSHENWKDADEYFSKAIHLKPKTASNYVNRAVARLRLNNLRGAMADYDLALNFEPNNFLAHYNRGLLRQQVGDDNRAIEDFDYVLSLEPGNVMALFNRATLLDKTGNLRAAIRDYTKVIDQFPNFWTGLHYRAGCYRRLGMTAKAELDEFRILKAQMDKHLGKQPRWSRQKLAEIRKKSEIDPEKYNQLVVDDDATGDHEYKSEYRGKVQNHRADNQYQPYFCLSLYRYNNGLVNYHPFDRDVDAINKNQTLCPLYLSTIKTQLTEAEIKKQFTMADSLTVLITSCRDLEQAKTLTLLRSVTYSAGQNFSDAIKDADAVLSVDSTNALAWWQRAICNIRLAEYEQSASSQTSSLRTASVISDLETALHYAPENAFVLYCIGTYYAQRQEFTKSIEYLTKALQIDPRLPEAYFNRGLARLQSGDKEGSYEDFGKAGELGLYSAYSIIKSNSKK